MSRDDKSEYYDAGGIEVFDIIRAKLTDEMWAGWLMGNVLKYACRAMHKHESPKRDIEKALVYLTELNDAFGEEA